MGQVLKRYRKLPKTPQFGLFIALFLFTISLLAGLRADASPMPTQTLSGTITTSQTLNPSFVYVVTSGVEVASGATLTIPAGTIVKYESATITVRSAGSLRVTGTSASPVHFTSIKDDTVGGDTNGDGATTSPAIDDFQRAIQGNEGDINVVGAKFSYASSAIEATRTSGNIVITDSTFEDSHNAINAMGPTVKLYRNQFNNLSPYSMDGGVQIALAQDLTKIPLSGIDQNVFTGTNKFSRIIRIEDALLPAGKTWSPASSSGATVYARSITVDGAADFGVDTSLIIGRPEAVDVNGTMTIRNGAWVKYEHISSYISVAESGKFYTTGTSLRPVHFTSIKDDSVGGDTNGDGDGSVAASGDYGAALSSQGEFNIVFAHFNYAQQSINATTLTKTLVVTDSIFSNGESAAYLKTPVVKLYRNSFSSLTPASISGAVQISSIQDLTKVSLNGSDKNTFIGTAPFSRIIKISDALLPTGKTWQIDQASGVTPYFERVSLNGATTFKNGTSLIAGGEVAVYGTLSIQSGSWVKYDWYGRVMSKPGGTINIGSSGNSTVLTSIKDDTIGGDTNGDGPSSGIIGSMGIEGQGGSFLMDNAIVRNLNYSFVGKCSESQTMITIKNSTLNIPVQIEDCVRNKLQVEHNTFAMQSNSEYPLVLSSSDVSAITAAGSNRNVFVGEGKKVAVRLDDAYVEQGNTWSLDSSANAVLVADGTFTVRGALDIGAGITIKHDGAGTFDVKTGGALNVHGSSTSKTVFTSIKDDTVGGDTNNDGASTGSVGSVSLLNNGGTINIDNAVFRKMNYALWAFSGNTGMSNTTITQMAGAAITAMGNDAELELSGMVVGGSALGLEIQGGSATFRGQFSDIVGYAIKGCNWGSQNCSVDAAYVDWGTGGAPATGSVCGQVTVSPWGGGGSTTDGLFTSKNCDNSPTPADQLSSSTQHFGQRMSVRGIECGNGFEDACEAMRVAQRCLGAATTLAASTSSFPLPNGNAYEQPAQWGSMLAGNASAYIQSVEGPNPILSAAGFANQLIGALTTIMNVSNAYGTCAP